MKKMLGILALLLGIITPLHAASMEVDLPYDLGSLQLPWQSTEVFYGAVKPFAGSGSGSVEEIAGASLPVVTLGKLKSGERIIDGQVGVSGAWPSTSNPVNVYTALGHDFAQDVPALKQFGSLHLNGALTWLNTGSTHGWAWGGSLSYNFGSGS